MWTTKINAKRTSETTVEVALSLHNISVRYGFIAHELIALPGSVQNEYDYAVVFHFNDISGTVLSDGSEIFSKTISVNIPKTVNCEGKKLRVFYWNDNVGELSSVLDCFKTLFIEVKLDDSKIPVGPFKMNFCNELIPRQGGNGGVVGIADNCN
ncbi:hypothetical protein NHF50_05365 [Flavobacterium sp. NRK F10]|uniref:Uncharacterized protein n=1 Tax=Flavobacterium sediminis TaxID=2201181 RepID=A0A2U8QT23_9FLAO|nr:MULTISPECIES: hypothetical protein [Flavobacterium]AWM13288.1 hypothetical protein DI487_05025 [Flavobacterium sediminis]MCO6174468.1 hypothetical protein [Flavobacterium sp. NRK F10]